MGGAFFITLQISTILFLIGACKQEKKESSTETTATQNTANQSKRVFQLKCKESDTSATDSSNASLIKCAVSIDGQILDNFSSNGDKLVKEIIFPGSPARLLTPELSSSAYLGYQISAVASPYTFEISLRKPATRNQIVAFMQSSIFNLNEDLANPIKNQISIFDASVP